MKYNNNEVNNIKFNGADINVLKLNGVEVWRKVTPPPLPEGYVEVEYIESSRTQYIDTDWYPTSKILAIYFTIMPLQNLATTSICGDENALYTNARWLWTLYGQAQEGKQFPLIGTWNNNRLSSYYITTPAGQIVSAYLTYNDGITTCTSSNGDSWVHEQIGDNIIAHLGTLKLFQNTNSQRSSIRMYKFKIYDNNVLVRDFVPARRISDSVVGMYDTVTQTFFGNSGSGEFIAGPPVN